MITATIKKVDGSFRTSIEGVDTNPVEAAMLIASVCEAAHESWPEMKPKKLLRAARKSLRRKSTIRKVEEEPKKTGLDVRCHRPQLECEHFDHEDGWCNRFNRPCAEIHDAGEVEDE